MCVCTKNERKLFIISVFVGWKSSGRRRKKFLCWFCIVPYYYIIFTTTKQLTFTQTQIRNQKKKQHAHSLTDKCDFMLIVERLPGEFYPFMLFQAFHLIPAVRINILHTYHRIIHIRTRIHASTNTTK